MYRRQNKSLYIVFNCFYDNDATVFALASRG